MTKSKYYLITLLTAILLSVVLGSSSAFASDISSISQAEATITIPLTQWNELKDNNARALSLIEASSLPLAKAKMLSMKQEVTLSKMESSLIELKEKVEKDNRTIKRLKMQRNLSQMVGAGAIIGVVIHR